MLNTKAQAQPEDDVGIAGRIRHDLNRPQGRLLLQQTFPIDRKRFVIYLSVTGCSHTW